MALVDGNLSSLLKVVFVPDEVLDDVLVSQFLNLIEPAGDAFEGGPVRHIVNNEDSVSPSVVTAHDGFETVLASSVPLN